MEATNYILLREFKRIDSKVFESVIASNYSATQKKSFSLITPIIFIFVVNKMVFGLSIISFSETNSFSHKDS